jgi:BirA family biotin operon repressor/biotin-[acetyl-CoA-carboxylase] ligase
MIFRDRAHIHLDSVDSTNNYAANLLRLSPPPDGTVITTLDQTSGKGQRGSVWLSSKGENLLSSFIVYPKSCNHENSFILSQLTALAVADTIENYTQRDVKIKWPNDILVNRKKICGILIELNWSVTKVQSAIIGIGINVNQTRFELPHASSLRNLSGHVISPTELRGELIQHFDKRYEQFARGGFSDLRRNYLETLIGVSDYERYKKDNQEIIARIIGVDPSGIALLEEENGKQFSADIKDLTFIY